ncbi:MAG: NFACT family protein [Thermodesulfobacteriota bacterium]
MVLGELREEIVGSTLSSAHQSDERRLLLRLFARGRTRRLLISAHPELCRIHLTSRRYKNPPAPLRFCAYLRAHLIGATLSDISHREGERIGTLTFKKGTGGGCTFHTLVFELRGKSSNVILLNDRGIILDAMRYFPSEEGCPRPVAPNLPFIPLPPGGRDGGEEIPKGPHETWNEAADAHYGTLEEREHFEREKGRLLRLVRRRTRHIERKLEKLNGDWMRAEAYQKDGRLGELLLAHFAQMRKGMSEIAVDDYQSDPPEVVRIPLDRSLGPQENIDRIFSRARKGKRAIEMLKRRIPETEGDLEYMRGLQMQTTAARAIKDLDAIKRKLRRRGYIHEVKAKKGRQGKSEPIRRFTTSEGLEILCGKNDAGNDLLIRKYARGNDLWFHAADVSGAHLLLRLKNGKTATPRKVIEEAASLAAFYSKARGEKRAEVAYTQAKNVRKPKGAKPGAVIITNYKTLSVEPRSGRQ